jgi:hypothetical protein
VRKTASVRGEDCSRVMECAPRQGTVHGKRMIAGEAVEEEPMARKVVVAGGMMLPELEPVLPRARSTCQLEEG